MTFVEAMNYIASLKPCGMKMGLERIDKILALCGHPERKLRFIHVAGTNGKGSTSSMIQSILTHAGYRTGLYTSPIVTDLCDTITVDNISISKKDFAALTADLIAHQEHLGDVGSLSEFEFVTALAFLYFANQHTDICVIECGLGGSDDATNIIPAPLAAVITPISLDHTAVLGNTIKKITNIKCGIIKPSCSVVTSPVQDEEALAVILEAAANSGTTVHIPSSRCANNITQSLGHTEFEYDGMQLTLNLTGIFQRDNALTAIEAVRAIEKSGFPVTKAQIEIGLKNVAAPCRQEVISQNPLIIIDGAHNPQGISTLAKTLELNSMYGLTLIVGMLADKNAKKCMSLLLKYCRRIICCTPNNARALPAEKLADIISSYNPNICVETTKTPKKALELALTQSNSPLLIAGSFYVASVLRPIILDKI